MTDENLDFQAIYAAYQPKLLRYLSRLVNPDEAEDLTQEVFVKVNQALTSFRGESKLSTWLYRIATHTAIDRLRAASFKQGNQQSSLDDTNDLADINTWTLEEPSSLEQLLMRKEMYQCFIDYLGQLAPNYRAVVVLSELEELPNSEIAEVLGLSLDVVKIRLHRGRTRLLEKLKAHCKAEDWL